MLQVQNTEKNTGILVSGNKDDLAALSAAFESVIGDEGDYLYEAACRQRILNVCRALRPAWQSPSEETHDANEGPCCACRLLWPEAVFVAAVLDNFVFLASARKCYVKRLPDARSTQYQTVSTEQIALIHYFQDLVWGALERFVGEGQLRAIFGRYHELRGMHFKYPQFDGFCTQWLDVLNSRYAFACPKDRAAYLTTILKGLITLNKDYLALKDSIEAFAGQSGIYVAGVSLTAGLLPDGIAW